MRNLIPDMPYLFSRFEQGHLSEAMILAIMTPLDNSTATERHEFDRFYTQHPDLFDAASTTEAKNTAQKAIDLMRDTPRTEEIEDATADRYLRIRKGKDCFYLNGKVAPEIGVALDDFLNTKVNQAINKGDTRTRSQLRADLFVRAITGHPLDKPLPINLHVNLVMTDRSLFMRTPDTAAIPGYGSIPAEYARQLLADIEATFTTEPSAQLTNTLAARINAYPMFRRLFMAPNSQDLVTMDSKERFYDGNLRHLIQLRDQFCRTPYCTNKPEHLDHVKQAAKGGATSFSNGAWKCASCNLAKEAPGWEEEVESSAPHRLHIRPTSGVEYVSSSPPTTGMGRMNRILFQAENLIPPVPVKYPPPDPDGITIT
ncbi:HNH endonuclease [Glutamicibacter sp. NPDC087344]|uniref:HNH endonuclease n=1 Tax=Glutamicibacter sp. NPDC087344 TaxID=3363994 RepID=UPI0037F9FEEE